MERKIEIDESALIAQMTPRLSDEYSLHTVPSNRIADIDPAKRTAKQRKTDPDEYKQKFIQTPKITDRQPVFVSREVRDRIDSVVRRLGERKMSVSGFLENLARHHLDMYANDFEFWRKM